MVRFANGCVCCGIKQTEMANQVVGLAKSGDYDNIIIEVSGAFQIENFIECLAKQAPKTITEDVKRWTSPGTLPSAAVAVAGHCAG